MSFLLVKEAKPLDPTAPAKITYLCLWNPSQGQPPQSPQVASLHDTIQLNNLAPQVAAVLKIVRQNDNTITVEEVKRELQTK